LKLIMGEDPDPESSDEEPEEPEPTPAPKEDAAEGVDDEQPPQTPPEPVIPRPPFPDARLMKELCFPSGKTLGPESYKVQEALVEQLQDFNNKAGLIPLADLEEPPQAPPSVMLIGCAFMMETIMAVLTANSRKMDEEIGRLGGGSRLCSGDAVVMESHNTVQVSGEEFDEKYRLSSELWSDVLARPNWRVIQHIRGSGKPSENPDWYLSPEEKKKKGLTSAVLDSQAMSQQMIDDSDPFLDDGEDGEDGGRRKKAKPHVRGVIGNAFAQYCGEPLIFSHTEFTRLVLRAGRAENPVDPKMMRALRPLVKDYVLPEDRSDYDPDSDVDPLSDAGNPLSDAGSTAGSFFAAGSGMNAARRPQ